MSWETVRFGDLYAVESRNGLTKPGKVRGSGYKMINMGELFANDRIYDIPMEFVPLKESEKLNARVECGDLLFARQSLVLEGAGKCSIVMEVSPLTVFEACMDTLMAMASNMSGLVLILLKITCLR